MKGELQQVQLEAAEDQQKNGNMAVRRGSSAADTGWRKEDVLKPRGPSSVSLISQDILHGHELRCPNTFQFDLCWDFLMMDWPSFPSVIIRAAPELSGVEGVWLSTSGSCYEESNDWLVSKTFHMNRSVQPPSRDGCVCLLSNYKHKPKSFRKDLISRTFTVLTNS